MGLEIGRSLENHREHVLRAGECAIKIEKTSGQEDSGEAQKSV